MDECIDQVRATRRLGRCRTSAAAARPQRCPRWYCSSTCLQWIVHISTEYSCAECRLQLQVRVELRPSIRSQRLLTATQVLSASVLRAASTLQPAPAHVSRTWHSLASLLGGIAYYKQRRGCMLLWMCRPWGLPSLTSLAPPRAGIKCPALISANCQGCVCSGGNGTVTPCRGRVAGGQHGAAPGGRRGAHPGGARAAVRWR
jgi:hypothetical protein